MITTNQSFRRSHCSALTLIEMLVVLSIMAVLSTVALRSVVGLLDEKNYDANILQLEEIEKAVLGDENGAGFVSDIGRLPEAVVDLVADPEGRSRLAELWNHDIVVSKGVNLYSIRVADGDSEVRLGTGWRGPYLNLGINRRDLTDSFANPFQLFQANGAIAANANPIAYIQSLGADGAASGISYDEDLEAIFQVNAGVLPTPDEFERNEWRTKLNVTVNADVGQIGGGRVVIRIYGPDGNGDLQTLEQVSEEIPLSGTPSISMVLDGDDDATVDTGPGLPVGAKVIRAYRVNTDPEVLGKQGDILAAQEGKSPVTHINIDRFTDAITLTLY